MRKYSIERRAEVYQKILKQIGHALRNPCKLCGAKAGEPCVSRTGKQLLSIGHTHDARLSTNPWKQTKSLRRYWI